MILLDRQYKTGEFKMGENGVITLEMWCYCSS